VTVTADDGLVVALRMARVWHVSPVEVLRMPSDIVMAGLQHDDFLGEYEMACIELNKK
jgi:hypothetical protein